MVTAGLADGVELALDRHRRTSLPVAHASSVPACEKPSALTAPSSCDDSDSSRPWRLHNDIFLSPPPVASRSPLGEKVIAYTVASRSSVDLSSPVDVFHT